MKEKYGIDGNLAEAVRTVSKSGSIRFDGSKFQSDFLKNYAGEKVQVLFTGCNAYEIGPVMVRELHTFRYICMINSAE